MPHNTHLSLCTCLNGRVQETFKAPQFCELSDWKGLTQFSMLRASCLLLSKHDLHPKSQEAAINIQ